MSIYFSQYLLLMKARITDAFLSEFVMPEGKLFAVVSDIELPQFAVKVTPPGKMQFIISYCDSWGEQQREALGRVGTMSAKNARAKAWQRLQDVYGLHFMLTSDANAAEHYARGQK